MDMYSIIMLVVMIALFYFLMIRPENKRKKAAQEMRDALKKGDSIVTIGGIMGKVVSVGDESFVIETSEDRVRIELVRWAIQNVEAVAEKATASESVNEKKGGLFGKKKAAEEPTVEAVPEEPVAVEAPAEETAEEK